MLDQFLISSAVRLTKSFFADQQGGNSIEYSLIVSGVALAILTGVGVLGTQVLETFESINATIASTR